MSKTINERLNALEKKIGTLVRANKALKKEIETIKLTNEAMKPVESMAASPVASADVETAKYYLHQGNTHKALEVILTLPVPENATPAK